MKLKKFALILIGASVLLFASCENGTTFTDGIINVSLSNLDQLDLFVIDTSIADCLVFEEVSGSMTFVSGSSLTATSNGFSWGVGHPDYVFTGGKTYHVVVWIDIDGDDTSDGTGDYQSVGKIIIVDGEMTVSFSASDFTKL